MMIVPGGVFLAKAPVPASASWQPITEPLGSTPAAVALGDPLVTYGSISFNAPADGFFYDGDHGGNDGGYRGVESVGAPQSGSLLEVDFYSPEVMSWSKTYWFEVVGSLDTVLEGSSFDTPPVPAGILPIGTYTFAVDISLVGDIETIRLFYGTSETSGDRSWVLTDIRIT